MTTATSHSSPFTDTIRENFAFTPASLIATLKNGLLKIGRAGLLLPLAAASAVSVVSLHATGHVSLGLAMAAFLCVYSSYLIDHLSEVDAFDAELASARSRMLAAKRGIALAGATAYVLALVITGWQSGLGAVLMLLSFPIAVVIYCAPVLPCRSAGRWRMVRLKDIPGLKAAYTAFFWGWLMSFALVFHHTGTLATHLAFGGFMFLALFVNTVLCDFKDMERDRLDGVPTLPLMLGAERTFRLLQGVSLAAGLWLVLCVALNWLPMWCLAMLATRVYAATMLHGARTGQFDLGRIGEAGADFEFVLWLPCALTGLAFLAA